MRPLLLLLVVILAFFAVRWFRPAAAQAEEAPRAASADPEAVRFLSPPVAAATPDPEPAPSTVEEASRKAWPASLLPAADSAGTPDEVGLAAALLHGTPAEVQALTGSIARDRALLLESFAWALAGERTTALSLSAQIGDRESLDGRERALFEAALTRDADVRPTSSTPVAFAMEMALLAMEAQRALGAREFARAATAFSALLVAEIHAAWPADRDLLAAWSAGLETAQREHRWNPRGEWAAVEMTVESGDSLIALRTGLIERANRIRGHLQPGQVLKVPTDPVRVLVDLEDRWALFFLGQEVAAAWPVGIGRPGEDTPPGDYVVKNKLENPPWMKEGQEPIPFGDPRNPLGTRWMGWSTPEGARTSYGFHGTWEPESIGQAASDGCIRLLNDDAEELFLVLPEGAPIRIQGGGP
jgi:lipoprotein-anchoring transpeptidase ErfK/SrfK